MPSLANLSPLRAVRDLRVFLSARRPYELIFLALSLLLTGGLIAGFVHDSHEARPYKRNIQYFKSWPLTRTDAEIRAQQKIDGVEQSKRIAEQKQREAALRASYKKLDDQLKSVGL